MLFYTGSNAYREVWENNELVGEYAYYDNYDMPEHISESEWDKRRIDWEKATPYYKAPSMTGVIVKIIVEMPNVLDLNVNNIKDNIPCLENRVENIVDRVIRYDVDMEHEEFRKYKKTIEYPEVRAKRLKKLLEELEEIEISIF